MIFKLIIDEIILFVLFILFSKLSINSWIFKILSLLPIIKLLFLFLSIKFFLNI